LNTKSLTLNHFSEVKTVSSFEELISTPFTGKTNALCWQRDLSGDFDEVAEKLNASKNNSNIDESTLKRLKLTDLGSLARDTLIADQRLLKEHQLCPSLDCISAYPTDEETRVIPTDVYSFHVDSSPIEVDTYLCSYNVAASEGLRNSQAIRKVDDPKVKKLLFQIYEKEKEDGQSFIEYLNDHYYDLHYQPNHPKSKPYSFGLGNLWRCATQWPGSSVLPCIHRAPPRESIQAPRLLLIS
jgi:hypothetical protein